MSPRGIWLTGPERTELRHFDPRPLRPGEVRVAIEAATTCGTDLKVFLRGGHPRMLSAPSPFGHEMTGIVREVTPESRQWRVGDRVVVANSASCGECRECDIGRENLCHSLQYLNGAFASEIVVPPRFVERSLHPVPDSLSAADAALAEPLGCVIHGLEMVDPPEGASALVIGAGPIGLLFVDVLRSRPGRLTVADPNDVRLAIAEAIGANETVRVERHAARSLNLCSFDVVIEATGAPSGWTTALEAVSPGGSVLLFGGCAPGTSVPLDAHRLHYDELTVVGAYHHRPSTFAAAIAHLASGDSRAGKLISGEVPLEETEAALRAMQRREGLKYVIRP